MKLLEFLTNFRPSKRTDQYQLTDKDVDEKHKLPADEEPELPILDNNSIYYSLNAEQDFKDIKEMILTYRNMSNDFNVEDAIDEIVNESIVSEDSKNNIELNLDNVELRDNVKKKIMDEFDYLLNLLNFKRKGSSVFRQWYVDGRLWYQILFFKNENKGVAKLVQLSPLDITRKKNEADQIFYVYREDESNKQRRRTSQHDVMRSQNFREGVRISAENIVFVPSGITNGKQNYYISHLHKAIKPLNQLRLLEDSAVIYRITRAPERRVFYIDVGKLRRTSAQNYVKKLMNKFKSSVNYDVQTGKVTQNKKTMTMLEDFYLPTRSDTKGTKVDVLPGGAQLSDIEDIKYFKKNFLRSLKVPYNRFETEDASIVNIGQPGELTRPELKFQKFVRRLQSDFSVLFYELLKIQLVAKKIINIKEWSAIKNDINFVWAVDNYFEELKQNEILSQRLNLLSEIKDDIGKFYSSLWVKKNVLKQTEDDIKNMEKEIKAAGDDKEIEEN